MDLLSSAWHWSFSGVMIVLVMFCLIYLGKRFGVSSSFKATCSALGAGKSIDYFNYDWKSHDWLFVFVLGSMIGGFIASQFMSGTEPMTIASSTLSHLSDLGINSPNGAELVPMELFGIENMFSTSSLLLMIGGGLLIGFGTRYAGGCTSGHAISGLSNLQLPSLVAVVGFFIGGLSMTYFILPALLK